MVNKYLLTYLRMRSFSVIASSQESVSPICESGSPVMNDPRALPTLSQSTGLPSPFQLILCILNDVQADKNISSMKDSLFFKDKLHSPVDTSSFICMVCER